MKISLNFNRPLLPLALAAVSGVFTASLIRSAWRMLVIGLILCLAIRVFVRVKPSWIAFAVPAVLLLTGSQTAMGYESARADKASAGDAAHLLTGLVWSIPEHFETTSRFIVRRTDGSKVYFSGRVSDQSTRFADQIQVEVYYSFPAGKRNPGGFNEAGWLLGKGVLIKARPADGSRLVISRPSSIINLPQWGLWGRNLAVSLLNNLLGEQQANLLSGLLLGDSKRIDQQTQTDFRRSGISHLLSVSGTHVSYLMLPAGHLIQKTGLGRRKRLGIMLLLLLAFGFITGWRAPVFRAILMSGCVLSGKILHRPADAISSLSLAAVLLLVIQPFAAFAVGFWLSFAATAALALLSGPLADGISGKLPFLPQQIVHAFSASLSVHLGLMPLLAAVNNGFSVVGLFANLPAGFLAAAIFLLTVLLLPPAGLISLISIRTASALAAPLGLSADLLAFLAKTAGNLRLGRLAMPVMNPVIWIIWLILCLGWLARIRSGRPAGIVLRNTAARLRLPAVAVCLMFVLWGQYLQPAVQVWFLDVGQGDAILILTRQGESVLIDGGNAGQGWRVIMPALDELGIARIDLVIATHSHEDHAGGLIEVVEAGRADHLMISALEANAVRQQITGHRKCPLADLLAAAGASGIKVSELSGNDTITLGRLIRLDVLNVPPLNGYSLMPGYDANRYSLILEAALASCRVLFKADSTLELESELIDARRIVKADVLKVAHHGSRFGTTRAFLAAAAPAVAVISVGPNYYGHPAAETIQRLSEAGSGILRTDHEGAILLEIGRRTWTVGPAYARSVD